MSQNEDEAYIALNPSCLDASIGAHSINAKQLIYTCKYIDGSVQDCSYSIANALELLQSCTNPSICPVHNKQAVQSSLILSIFQVVLSYKLWRRLSRKRWWSYSATHTSISSAPTADLVRQSGFIYNYDAHDNDNDDNDNDNDIDDNDDDDDDDDDDGDADDNDDGVGDGDEWWWWSEIRQLLLR